MISISRSCASIMSFREVLDLLVLRALAGKVPHLNRPLVVLDHHRRE
jgi:hypothetical protein